MFESPSPAKAANETGAAYRRTFDDRSTEKRGITSPDLHRSIQPARARKTLTPRNVQKINSTPCDHHAVARIVLVLRTLKPAEYQDPSQISPRAISRSSMKPAASAKGMARMNARK